MILRWSIGVQDTTQLRNFDSNQKLLDMFWLTKLSVVSFQRWFPDARFLIFYNGNDFDSFVYAFNTVKPDLLKDVEFIDQVDGLSSGRLSNRYHFFPMGVWWKWVPFRYDILEDEISIDTDIICINKPNNLIEWVNSNKPILIAPERFDKMLVNTCGDLWKHPVLTGKSPLNCGIVGHKAGYDFSDRFYDTSKSIDLGFGQNSFFINEQGVINIWVYSLEIDGIEHFTLDFNLNAWVRDFVYFLKKGVIVETVHATTWHKKIIHGMKKVFEDKIINNKYLSNDEFLLAISENYDKLDAWSQYVIKNQISGDLKEFQIISS